jgi:hypothetical protein
MGVEDEMRVEEELGMGITVEEEEDTGGCPPSHAPNPNRHPEPQ